MQEKKKKILFSAYSLDVGGIETALVTLLNYLSKTDEYDITLVLEKKRGIFLEKLDKKVKVIKYTPSYIKLIGKGINAIKRAKFTLLYKNKFDASFAYATYCRMASFTARTASENASLWVHNNYYYFFNKDENAYKEFFNSICAHSFKNILFVSEEAKKQYVEKYGVLLEELYVCNNLINYKRIQKLAKEEIPIKRDDTVTTFINVARHDEHQKRITRLIESAKLLKQDDKKFRILLVGAGNDTKQYKEMVEKYNLVKEVIFVGNKSNPYPYYDISDCVILTSEYEGYPVVYVEANVLNKPIITTDVSDSKKEIENKFGIVTEKNVQSIYNTMKSFIENGYEIKEKFDPVTFNNNIIEKINKIINNQ